MSSLSELNSALKALAALGVSSELKNVILEVAYEVVEKSELQVKNRKVIGPKQQLTPRKPRDIEITEEYSESVVDPTGQQLFVMFKMKYIRGDVKRMTQAVKVLAQEAIELTPRDTGRLQRSQYKKVYREGDYIMGVVGYNPMKVYRRTKKGKTYYALPVHNRYANHSQVDYPNNPPRATWKFLYYAIKNDTILRQIREILNGR